MKLEVEIDQKQITADDRVIKKPSDVYELDEIKAIQNALYENVIFIGLDRRNHIKDVSLLAMGNNNGAFIQGSTIVHKAIMKECCKVILVHNHPSGIVRPSKRDILLTKKADIMLEFFDIELLDHIVVGKDNYLSIYSSKEFLNYENTKLGNIEKIKLIEENKALKQKISELEKEKNRDIDEDKESNLEAELDI